MNGDDDAALERAPIRDEASGLTRDYGSILLRQLERPKPASSGLPSGGDDLTDAEKQGLQQRAAEAY